MKKLLCSALLLAMTLAAQAEVKLPKIFGDNMVLQQQTECNLWGTADANKVVKVRASWNGKTYKTQADAQGKWAMKIETPQAGGPYELSLSDGKELKLHNILIGEVWICSGQSNMEMPMKGFKAQPVAGTPEELMLCKDQQLRLFTVQRNAQLHPVDTVAGDWKEADAASVREFSAAAYYYGKTLRQSLGVPVGLIVTSWGGSACEAWINGNLIKSDWLKAFPKLHTPWNEADVKKYQQRCPSALYNGMLHPLIGYTMKGVIWYQGEDNCNRYATYADQMQTLVNSWRKEWKQGIFPFYYCQIAPYDYSLIKWKTTVPCFVKSRWRQRSASATAVWLYCLMPVWSMASIHVRRRRWASVWLCFLLPILMARRDCLISLSTRVLSSRAIPLLSASTAARSGFTSTMVLRATTSRLPAKTRYSTRHRLGFHATRFM